MSVDPAKAAATVTHEGADILLLQPRLWREVQGRSGEVSRAQAVLQRNSSASSNTGRDSEERGAADDVRLSDGSRGARVQARALSRSAAWRSSPRLRVTSTRTEWTCPMHPEIVRDEPGFCPICGMALEPLTVTAAEEDNPELRDMTRRFWWSVLLGVPLVALAMLHMGPLAHTAFRALGELDRVRSGHAGRAVGRMAVLPARLGIGEAPQPEHVHADRDGRRRGLHLQRGRDASAADLS